MVDDASDPDRQPTLSGREARVQDELRRLDPRLAGLFLQGLGYLGRLDEPGSIHMLSHAGREISNGVIRILSGEGAPITEDEGEEEQGPRQKESQRRRIAVILDLPEQHPSVTTWAKAHDALVSTAHFGSKPPSPGRVEESVRAFRVLTDILFGRIGLYFDARQEIESLLEVEEPNEEHLRRLQALIGRPQLRHAFFGQLRHVGWLEPLAAAGLFEEPPDVRTDPDTGQLTAPPWPEAGYLERLAPDAPEQVVQILQSIPDGIRNPVVWRGVADTTLRLPADHAARVVPKLRTASEQSTHPMVSRGVFAVAEKLALAGDGNALELLRALVRLQPVGDTGPLATSDTGQIADVPGMRHTTRPDAFVSLVEGVAHSRPRPTLGTLAGTLNRTLEIEHGDPTERARPVADHSRYWHGHVQDDEDRSPKSLLAAAVMRAALVAADSEEAGDLYVLERLSRYPWEVFLRLRLAFLARRPVFDQQALDSALADPDLLEAPHVLPEYRQLLQTRLADASAEVRQSVVDRILHGPTDDEVARFVGADDPDPETAKKHFVQEWQRHRLRIFGDDPPPELDELAMALGTIGESLSKRDHDLDRHGFAVEAGVGGGPKSPLTPEEIQNMNPGELVEYLRTWEPERGWDAPSPAGLASVIAVRVQEDVAWAANLLERSRDEGLDPTCLRGALDGLTAALKADRPIPWQEALRFMEWLFVQPPEPGAPADYFDYRDPGLEWTRKVAADLLSEAASGDLVPEEHRDALWSAVDALIRTEVTWISAEDVPTNMDRVLHLELNELGGKAAEALLDVALHDYRAWKQTKPETDAWPNQSKLRPLLDTILKQSGEAGIAARSALGRYLPQVMLMDEDWLEANRTSVFHGAVEEPFRNPTFASYVVRSRLYGKTFEQLRPLYDAAVAATAEDDDPWTSGEESFRPGRHLLTQLVLAYRQGWLELGTDGDLLDSAFTNANPEDVSHVWWQIFRYWSDADDVNPDDVERVARLWGRRLDQLEQEARDIAHRREEAKGLAWLAMTDRIPDEVVLPLLLRGVRLSRGEVPIAGALWERLSRMAAVDIGQALEAAVLVIEAELRSDFPHFNVVEVAPILRIGLASQEVGTREVAELAIHKLGEAGFEQFGDLLREGEQEDG